jgi:hypothetical protein
VFKVLIAFFGETTVNILSQDHPNNGWLDKEYEYSAGNLMVVFYPMPMEVELVDASPAKPLLVAGLAIDLGRMADVLLRLDRFDGAMFNPVSTDLSGIFNIPLSDFMLDPFIRLAEILANPRDTAMLGNLIMEEIYYRLLCNEQGGELRFLLQQKSQIQRIS